MQKYIQAIFVCITHVLQHFHFLSNFSSKGGYKKNKAGKNIFLMLDGEG
jgi:hypothetical protein